MNITCGTDFSAHANDAALAAAALAGRVQGVMARSERPVLITRNPKREGDVYQADNALVNQARRLI